MSLFRTNINFVEYFVPFIVFLCLLNLVKMPDSSNHPLFQYYCHSLPYGSVREYGKPPSVINTVLYSRTHLYRRCRAGRDKIRTIRVQCGHRAALGIHGNRNVAQTNLISINLDPGPSHSLCLTFLPAPIVFRTRPLCCWTAGEFAQ